MSNMVQVLPWPTHVKIKHESKTSGNKTSTSHQKINKTSSYAYYKHLFLLLATVEAGKLMSFKSNLSCPVSSFLLIL